MGFSQDFNLKNIFMKGLKSPSNQYCGSFTIPSLGSFGRQQTTKLDLHEKIGNISYKLI